jgi:tetratricopeptide (TPR) repeat protein
MQKLNTEKYWKITMKILLISKKPSISMILSLLIFNLVCVQNLHSADEAPKSEKEGAKSELSDWETRLEYARLLSYQKRYNESLEQYHKLLEKKPNSLEVQIEIANVLYYQGKYQEALNILNKIPAEKMSAKDLILVADINVATKNYPKGESIYRAVLQKNPSDDLTKFKLAELLSWQKKYQESINFYRQLLANNPSDIQLRRKYAMVLMWMGKEKEAAEELEKTLK